MLTLRLIDPNDYTVFDDGYPVGRIRLARDRSPSDMVVDRHATTARSALRRRAPSMKPSKNSKQRG
jgi:hypothetical protein